MRLKVVVVFLVNMPSQAHMDGFISSIAFHYNG